MAVDLRLQFAHLIKDPIKFARVFWPDVYFYKQQRLIMESIVYDHETFVPAGNMLGKDFVAAFIVLWFFMTRHPVRIVTTSADHSQLESVLWGELRRFIQTAREDTPFGPLVSTKGGPLVVNHLRIRKVVHGKICGISYLIGRVAAKGEGMLGHHAYPSDWDGKTPHSLFVADEASGVEDISYERADTWAHRKLIIGNPYPCSNFFNKGVEKGDIIAKA